MGITNINILREPDEPNRQELQVQAFVESKRVLEHRQGLHTYGNMRRDCPLCQAGK